MKSKISLGVMMVVISTIFIFSCKKSNTTEPDPTPTEPLSELRAYWSFDSSVIEFSVAGQVLFVENRTNEPGAFIDFFSSTQMAISEDGGEPDTSEYENINDELLVLVRAGERDTATILTLNSSELVVSIQQDVDTLFPVPGGQANAYLYGHK